MKNIIIFGATSSIAQSTARLFALRGDKLFLAGRTLPKLEAVAEDLKVRGAQIAGVCAIDLNQSNQHPQLISQAKKALGNIDIVLIAHGELGLQKDAEKSFDSTLRILETNFLSAVSLSTLIANELEKQKSGVLAVISSVAGDRGRQSNYIYGCAKGGLSLFLGGLRNRLAQSNVTVITIKPGPVDTPMTQSLKKGLLCVSPETIAHGILKAIDRKKDVVYLPRIWWWIMTFIQLIPERVFKKMHL
jgi:decaprenylphospho-beta-D-erythro-pentofuranosid-2-ulose 2-reductase